MVGFPFVVVLVIGMIGGGVAAVIIELSIYRTLRSLRVPLINVVVSTLGVSLILQNVARLICDKGRPIEAPRKNAELEFGDGLDCRRGHHSRRRGTCGFHRTFSLKQHSFTNGPSSGWRRLDLLCRFTKEINRVYDRLRCDETECECNRSGTWTEMAGPLQIGQSA